MEDIYKNRLQTKMEKILCKAGSNQYVLMFHSVSPRNMWYDRNYCITPESFERMILEIRSRGVQFASIDRMNSKSKNKTVYITFDDVYADVFINAYSILKKYKIPFAVFVTVDYINKENMISKEMLSDLSRENLCVIGAHTFSHRNLSKCNIGELFKEIYGAKCTLEFLIKRKVAYLAYPYGNVIHVPITAMIISYFSRYKGAFSTISAPVCNHMRYLMPRINVNEYNWKRIIYMCSK